MILHGISTIEVNWFNPKLLFDLPRKLFTILELSRRFILFTIFFAQLLTTLKIHFDIQLQILCTLIFNLGTFLRKSKNTQKKKQKRYIIQTKSVPEIAISQSVLMNMSLAQICTSNFFTGITSTSNWTLFQDIILCNLKEKQ